jgi:hypothetical protein
MSTLSRESTLSHRSSLMTANDGLGFGSPP